MLTILLLVLWGLCVGLMVGFTAVGKGLIGVPGLIVLFQMSPVAAAGSMAVAGFVMMLSGTVQHYRCGNVVVSVAALFSVSAIPASYLGARFANVLNEILPLQYIIGVVIVISVVLLFYRYVLARAQARSPQIKRWQLGLSPVTGLALGLLMGATSISGSIIVIAFIMLLKLPSLKAVGTTSVVSAISLLFASIAHIQEGNVQWAVVGSLTPGAIAGAAMGARYADHVPRQVLRMVILVLLLIAGVMLLIDP